MTGRCSFWFAALSSLLLWSFPLLAQEAEDPDLPRFLSDIDKATYLRQRSEFIDGLLGFPYDWSAGNPRLQAIQQMEEQQATMGPLAVNSIWRPIGPAPIPNGQTTSFQTPVSGRTISLAVHPANPDVVYAGTAQGGVYRSLDGGTNWTPIFDSAASLAVGALALAPSNPTILYVGTGEPNSSCDSFFGIGLYRIDNADTAPILNGPFNPPVTTGLPGTTAFTGRAISRILVHPTDPARIFVSTFSGIGGLGCEPFAPSPPQTGLRGVYRSTNATSASPTFEKLTVTTAGSVAPDATGNRSIADMTFDPANPNTIVCWVNGQAAGEGGVYRTVNAFDPTPTFTQVFVTTVLDARGEFSAVNVGGVTTILVATGETGTGTGCTTGSGALRRSTDGGLTWSAKLSGGGGFCGGQCWYDIAIAMRPTDPTHILLGGSANGTCSRVLARSTNNGVSFAASDGGLHADSHALAFAPSNPDIVYIGNDGGIYKSLNAGSTWASLNNSQFSATQFQSVAVHPSDLHFSIGGTQDNGTNWWQPGGSWIRADYGDGGFALIDQGAPDVTDVTMYHTYYNSRGTLIGFGRVTNTACATDGEWVFRGAGYVDATIGCQGLARGAVNGIGLTDSTQFYAPMALGPGTPNTLYFGTNRLYRSINRGDLMVVVSQAPILFNNQIAAIAIAPTDDNVRLVGMRSGGRIFGTTTGSSTLTDMSAAGMPARSVGRIAIDPTNANRAFVGFGGFGVASGQHVWRSDDLTLGAAGWVAAGNGLPDAPVNGLVVDPSDPNTVYAGTDVGVYYTTDAGANWVPYGTGLPVVAVFDMAIQQPWRVLRIATHGRGMWQIPLSGSVVGVETPLVAFVGAEFLRDRVQLSWHTSLPRGSRATVYRRPIPGDWTRLGEIAATAQGGLDYEDGAIRPGGRYAYVLGVRSGGAEEFFGEVTLTVPRGAPALAVGPNPSRGRLRATFSLSNGGAASLELVDLAGRRVDSYDLAGLGAGEHELELVRARSLGSGLYWLRLTQDGRSTTRKVVLSN